MSAFDWLPPDGFKILLVLFLSFLVGLEREEQFARESYRGFGGVRTFPLIGLIGYAMAFLAGSQIWAVAIGFMAICGLLSLSYWHKLATSSASGVTSEVSALTTYLIGALVSHDQFWIATTLSVASIILLELKTALEGIAKHAAPDDILTFTKFLLLAAVILPIVPNQDITPFAINPFKTWLVVVAVSGISYGSYVVLKIAKARGGLLLTAVLGGAYSSTMTTVVLSKRATHDARAHTVSGAILMASGMMYLRLAVLLALFNRALMLRLAPSFLARRDGADGEAAPVEHQPSNPLEIRAALMFAVFFVAMLIAGHLAGQYLGRLGIFILATIMGVTDVDPFIMSMTQAPPASTAAGYAASAILIAAASNNVVKGIYAFALAPRSTGTKALLLLLGLAAAGLTPLAL